MVTLIISYIFILVISTISFNVIQKSRPEFIGKEELKLWIKVWYLIISIAFITHHLWLTYFLVIMVFRTFVPPASSQKIIYYMLLLCALPLMRVEIPGLAGIRYIIKISYLMFLTLSLLLPVLLDNSLKKNKKKLSTDTYVFIYVLILIALNFRDNTITNALRSSVVKILDIYVPYAVISRYITTKEQLNKLLYALFVGLAPIALLGIFEAVKHWHVYDQLSGMMTGTPPRKNRYDVRAGFLRATTVAAGPIVFGYMMIINIGLLLYLQSYMSKKYARLLMVGLSVALICSFARGTWIGCIFMVIMYTLTAPGAITKLIKMTVIGVGSIVLLSFTEFGKKFIDLLPIIGNTRSDTIEYREKLMEISVIVFKKSPWFGSPNFRDDPLLEVMRQGQGIIDIVNSYVQIGLSSGGMGLLFFLLIFFSLIFGCYMMTRKLPKEEFELIQMGRVLFGILTAACMTIVTVSSIDYVPIFYWTLTGVAGAYLKICNKIIKQRRRN